MPAWGHHGRVSDGQGDKRRGVDPAFDKHIAYRGYDILPAAEGTAWTAWILARATGGSAARTAVPPPWQDHSAPFRISPVDRAPLPY